MVHHVKEPNLSCYAMCLLNNESFKNASVNKEKMSANLESKVPESAAFSGNASAFTFENEVCVKKVQSMYMEMKSLLVYTKGNARNVDSVGDLT